MVRVLTLAAYVLDPKVWEHYCAGPGELNLLCAEAVFQLHACHDFGELDFQKQFHDERSPFLPLFGLLALRAMASWGTNEAKSYIWSRHGSIIAG